jgi:hypothetical protein
MVVHPATEKQLILTSYLFALFICHETEVLNIVIKLLTVILHCICCQQSLHDWHHCPKGSCPRCHRECLRFLTFGNFSPPERAKYVPAHYNPGAQELKFGSLNFPGRHELMLLISHPSCVLLFLLLSLPHGASQR